MSLSLPLLCAANDVLSVCSPGEDPNADRTPPTISLNTAGTVTLFEGDEYVEALAALAIDDRDGELTVVISGSVGSEPGTYTITYTATDSAGNTTQISLEVVVIDGDFDLFAASTARIVAEMTLEQKVGQMIQPEIAYITLEEISQYGIGSVLNGAEVTLMVIARRPQKRGCNSRGSSGRHR